MRIRQRPIKRARIEIIPMIDVIFFLLVFFMVSSLAMTKINSLPVALPKTSSSPEAVKQDIILTVKKDGTVYINKTPTTVDSIASQLSYEMHDHPQDTVVVNADEGAGYGLVVKIMDRARSIGVRKFALATEADGSAKPGTGGPSSAVDRHRPPDTDPQIIRKSILAAFAIELTALMVVGYWDHWLAHPQKEGFDSSRFIEAQVFEVPKEAPHLVEEKIPAAAKKEVVLSKKVNQGRVPKPEDKTEDENQTEGGPKAVPTHGPIAIFSPPPVIPPYLRDKDLHASVVIDFYVTAQGASTPRLAGSSGNEELDALAVQAVQKWQFRPAEKDHKAIDAKVRLRIVFEVQ